MKWSDMEWFNPKKKNHETMVKKLSNTPSHWSDYYPRVENWYNGLRTELSSVKCVILGQDPYHTYGLATGYAFSVPKDHTKIPPSLRNIFTEYCSDLHYPYPRSGDLTPWAERGVLLWNTCLTVSPGRPGSHRDLGWEGLTNEVIKTICTHRVGVVFVCWGVHAKQCMRAFLPDVQAGGHCIIEAAHPSPFSARGFFGHRPFSRANGFLASHKQTTIDWKLP